MSKRRQSILGTFEEEVARALRRAKKGHEGAPRWLPGSSGIDYFTIGVTL